MHWVKTTAVSAIISVVACNVSAEDGVVVDLSVLNNLGAGYYEEPEPLFPVLPKQVARPAQVKKEAVKVSQPKTTNRIKKDVEPSVNKDLSNNVTAKKQNKKAKQNVPAEDDFVVVVDREPVVEQPKVTEPVAEKAEVKVEQPKVTEPVAEKAEVKVEQPKVIEPVAEKTEIIPEESVKIQIKDSSHGKNEAILQDVVNKPIENKTESVDVNSDSVNTMQQNASNNEQDKALDTTNEHKNNNIIRFAEEEDLLKPDQQEQLDDITKGFTNGKASKIAIYAYNSDDGVDSFRKKRMTLNRAIEIRSYLLKKGFKNFSIKVINVSGNSSKANTVKVKEI